MSNIELSNAIDDSISDLRDRIGMMDNNIIHQHKLITKVLEFIGSDWDTMINLLEEFIDSIELSYEDKNYLTTYLNAIKSYNKPIQDVRDDINVILDLSKKYIKKEDD